MTKLQPLNYKLLLLNYFINNIINETKDVCKLTRKTYYVLFCAVTWQNSKFTIILLNYKIRFYKYI